MGFSITLCGIFFALLAVACWLIFKKANPNWLIEFGYFLIVFFSATIAVLILRTSGAFGLYLRNGIMPDFKLLFKLTHGKFYVILITFCVLTYIVNLLQMRIMGALELWNIQQTNFLVVLVSEFLSSITKFAVLAVYVAYFSALSECLVPEDSAVKDVQANDVAPAAKAVRKKAPTKTTKGSNASKAKTKSGKKSK